MLVEVKHIFQRSNNGRKTFRDTLPPGRRVYEDKQQGPSKIEEWSDYAILLIEYSDDDGRFEYKSLRIQSPFLKEVLRDTIQHHPGETFDTDILELRLPIRSFFHCLGELKEKEASLAMHISKEESLSQLRCLLSWIENEFRETILEVRNLRSGGAITYKLLWSIFKPGQLAYTLVHGKPQIFKIINTRYGGGQGQGFLLLEGWYVESDGTSLGRYEYRMKIEEFDDSRLVASLRAIPLDQHPNREAITERLLKRGRNFESMRGQHHCVYNDVALKLPKKDISLLTIRRETDLAYVHGRIIVDGASFNRFNPNDRILVNKDDPAFKSCAEDEKYLLCSPLISGFALREKQWLRFFVDVDGPKPVVYDGAALESLVLHPTQKGLIKAMVENHVRGENKFDDIITGKGKGLIAVLHGPPGVGKTLAVESVAEHTKRPVYFASSGDLGTEPQEVDRNLERILDCVSTWKAILLLDEADVFMERRATKDLTRNALVSIFLRRLEYFPGIMFLTSNRVAAFDDAFESRIHLALRLGQLTFESRLAIWKTFLTDRQNEDGRQFDEIEPRHHQELARRKLNGRQIKNAVRMAQILATHKGSKLKVEHIKEVIGLQEEFHKDSDGGGVSLSPQAILILAFHTAVFFLAWYLFL